MKKDLTLLLLIISLALVLIAVTFKANAQSQERTTASPIGGAVVKVDTVTQAKPGNPIGGIIVKGGPNGVNAEVTPQSPAYSSSGLEVTSPLYQGGGHARVAGSPIGGIVVKGGHNGIAADDAKSTNPLYTPDTKANDNPLFKDNARTTGQPIGGIVVKGGQNPTRFEISNPIPSIGVVVKHNLTDRIITYTNDEPVTDAALLNSLGVTQLLIKKGVYPIDDNGRVTLHIEKIVHRDIAARTLQLQGYDAQTQTTYDYTVEPVIANGEINQIIITYKSISEKGVK